MTEIPDKLYFKIGEVAKLLEVESHVLRFWETEFPQLNPSKSKTKQRLYKRGDVELLLQIRDLLYKEKFTIEGARKQLKITRVKRGAKDSSQIQLDLNAEQKAVDPKALQRLGKVFAQMESYLKS